MDWDGMLAIALSIGLLSLLWKLNRYYERKGVIYFAPFSISRARAPTFFRVTMILNWMTFTFALLFSLMLAGILINSWL